MERQKGIEKNNREERRRNEREERNFFSIQNLCGKFENMYFARQNLEAGNEIHTHAIQGIFQSNFSPEDLVILR